MHAASSSSSTSHFPQKLKTDLNKAQNNSDLVGKIGNPFSNMKINLYIISEIMRFFFVHKFSYFLSLSLTLIHTFYVAI